MLEHLRTLGFNISVINNFNICYLFSNYIVYMWQGYGYPSSSSSDYDSVCSELPRKPTLLQHMFCLPLNWRDTNTNTHYTHITQTFPRTHKPYWSMVCVFCFGTSIMYRLYANVLFCVYFCVIINYIFDCHFFFNFMLTCEY